MRKEKKKLKKGATWEVAKVLWRHSRKHWGMVFLIFFAVAGINASQVISPLYYKKLIDIVGQSGISVPGIMPQLFSIFFVISGLWTLSWFLRRVRGFSNSYFESRVMSDLSCSSFDYLIRHSYRFFGDNFAGSLVRKVNKLTGAFENIFDQIQSNVLPLFFTILGILWVLFHRNVALGVILSIGIGIFLAFNIIAARWRRKYDIVKTGKDSEATGALADAIGNSSTIKLFSGYNHEESLFRRVNEELKQARLIAWGFGEGIDTVQGFIMLGIQIAMIYAAIVLWGQGILTAGDFVLIQIYIINIFDRMGDFGRVLRRLFEAFADASEMVDILNTPHEIQDVADAKPLIAEKGKIEFQNVSFGFHKNRNVFDNFTLKIEAGEKVAFVGSSGAGKSTLARLLCRLYDVKSGKILIDGQNIACVTQESLWNAVALVPQESVLFHRTLRENILYGKRGATDKEIIEAAKRAHAHEFISSLPYGYETYVGERGVKLSGGERQRVTIARAILKNPPILVLDEATSSLDSESEMFIQDALHELIRGRTVIAIAHRLSTIREMDRIIVIENGKIAAMGSHKKLLRQAGIYRKLWNIQAGNFMA